MVLGNEQTFAKFAPAVLIGQVALGVIGMAAFMFAPRTDQPALLYPLTAQAAKALPAIISRPGSAIAARGQVAGSYIVLGERSGFAENLLSRGILTLNAAAPGCGPALSDQARGSNL